MNQFKRYWLIALFYCLAAQAVAVPIVIDQDNFGSGSGAQGIIYETNRGPGIERGPRDVAQTFTVGLNGTLVGLWLDIRSQRYSDFGDLTIELRPVLANGIPEVDNYSTIFSTIFTEADFYSLDSSFLFISGVDLSVLAGDQFAIVARATGSDGAFLWGTNSGAYSRGSGFVRTSPQDGFGDWEQLLFDTNFRFLTCVESTENFPSGGATEGCKPPFNVPEPGSLALLSLGLVGMATRLYRRSKS
jgi:hypothetical protein